jgi:hypothetical protein
MKKRMEEGGIGYAMHGWMPIDVTCAGKETRTSERNFGDSGKLRPQEQRQFIEIPGDHGEDFCALHDGVEGLCVLLGALRGVRLQEARRCLGERGWAMAAKRRGR